LLCVASNMPSPDSSEFYECLSEALCRIIAASSGRAFVLFTSHSAMRRAAAECRPFLSDQGYRLLVQGEAGRHHLINMFRDDIPSVLFGTDSFWEGVDVRGSSLSSVIMVKLPFRVPTEPLLQAKLEAIQARGGDPFRELSLPEAVIRFRQGFGRLIRSRDDMGGVTVLDSRLVKRRYGRAFLGSLPRCTTLVGSIDEIESGLRQWLAAQQT
ncbi:MAG: helicase C-terminal domain-containing protein, partial [Bacillota bacterium]